MELTFSPLLALALIALLSAVLVLQNWLRTRQRLLPGPRPVPVIGNLHELDPAKPHATFEKMAEDYGKLVEFWIFNQRNIAVSDIELAKIIYWERPDMFRRSEIVDEAFQQVGVDGVFNMEGEHWRRHRRLIAPAFLKVAVTKMHHCIEIPVERLIKKWQNQIEDAGSARGFAVMSDPRVEMSRLTLDVVMYLACGYDLNSIENIDSHLNVDLSAFFSALNERVVPSLKRKLITKFVPFWDYKFRAAQKRVIDFVLALITQTKQDILAEAERGEPSRSFLLREMIIAHSTDENFTDTELLGDSLSIIGAGLDTTSILLGWSVFMLCKHPEYQKKLRDEVVSVVGESGFPKPDQLTKLTLVNNFLQETLRVKSPVPFLSFENNKELEYNGLTFPAKTQFWISNRKMINDSIPDSEVFRPERWADPIMTKDATASFLLSVPFGGGPRICPGRQLALIEAAATLAMLVRAFNFELDGPEPEERLNLVMVPTPYSVKVRHATL